MTVAVAAPSMLDFEVEVADITLLSPSYVRITFAGNCLRDFATGGRLGNRDRRIKLLIPSPGHPLPELDLAASAGGDTGWYRKWLSLDPAVRGAMRTYTVRHSRLGGRAAALTGPQLDVDFVLHFDAHGQGGPASTWAAAAQVGDRLTLIGPNAANDDDAGIAWHPGAARRVLIAGDETAVPAISHILEGLPAGIGGHAVVEVPTAKDFLALRTGSDVEVSWLSREGRPHGQLLDQAIRGGRGMLAAAGMLHRGEEPEDVDVDETTLWEAPESSDGGFYAWIAGEAAVVRELRRYLVREIGVDRRQMAFMGYWRQGKSERS